MDYQKEKNNFIAARNNFVKSINKNLGDKYKQQAEKFINDTNKNIKQLDKYYITVANISRDEANIISGQIYKLGTDTAKSFTRNLNSKDKYLIKAMEKVLPEALEGISNSLSQNLKRVESVIINYDTKATGWSH